MRRGGSSLFALSNTLQQLEQSSLHPSTVLRHRLLLQTTCYNHLRLLLHLLISSKEKRKQQQARGIKKPERALQPTTEINRKKCLQDQQNIT